MEGDNIKRSKHRQLSSSVEVPLLLQPKKSLTVKYQECNVGSGAHQPRNVVGPTASKPGF